MRYLFLLAYSTALLGASSQPPPPSAAGEPVTLLAPSLTVNYNSNQPCAGVRGPNVTFAGAVGGSLTGTISGCVNSGNAFAGLATITTSAKTITLALEGAGLGQPVDGFDIGWTGLYYVLTSGKSKSPYGVGQFELVVNYVNQTTGEAEISGFIDPH